MKCGAVQKSYLGFLFFEVQITALSCSDLLAYSYKHYGSLLFIQVLVTMSIVTFFKNWLWENDKLTQSDENQASLQLARAFNANLSFNASLS